MEIENTKERSKVLALRAWSIGLVNDGEAEEVRDWDKSSPWHNSKYIELRTGRQWVIYLPDNAWAGEVKILERAVAIT